MSEKTKTTGIEGLLLSLEFSLNPVKPADLEKAMKEANEAKAILFAEAKKQTIIGTSTEVNAKKLMRIMFNRFHSTAFDNLLDELIHLSPKPIEPVRMETNKN